MAAFPFTLVSIYTITLTPKILQLMQSLPFNWTQGLINWVFVSLSFCSAIIFINPFENCHHCKGQWKMRTQTYRKKIEKSNKTLKHWTFHNHVNMPMIFYNKRNGQNQYFPFTLSAVRKSNDNWRLSFFFFIIFFLLRHERFFFSLLIIFHSVK